MTWACSVSVPSASLLKRSSPRTSVCRSTHKSRYCVSSETCLPLCLSVMRRSSDQIRFLHHSDSTIGPDSYSCRTASKVLTHFVTCRTTAGGEKRRLFAPPPKQRENSPRCKWNYGTHKCYATPAAISANSYLSSKIDCAHEYHFGDMDLSVSCRELIGRFAENAENLQKTLFRGLVWKPGGFGATGITAHTPRRAPPRRAAPRPARPHPAPRARPACNGCFLCLTVVFVFPASALPGACWYHDRCIYNRSTIHKTIAKEVRSISISKDGIGCYCILPYSIGRPN